MHSLSQKLATYLPICAVSVALAACQATSGSPQIVGTDDPALNFSRSEASRLVRQGDAIEVTIQMADYDHETCEVTGQVPSFAEYVEEHPESQPLNGSIVDGGTRIHVHTSSECAIEARRILFAPTPGYVGPAYFVVEWSDDNIDERKIWVFESAPGRRLASEEIAQTHVGSMQIHADGYELLLNADGTFQANRGRFQTGSWQISNDQLCMSYNNRYDGCYEITVDETGTYHSYSPDRGWSSVEAGYTIS